MIEETEILNYPESFLEADLAELYAYPLEVVEGYMDQAVTAQDSYLAIVFAREIIRKNQDDNSDFTYGAYRILAAAYAHRKDHDTVIYLLGLMIRKFTALETELRRVLQKFTQGRPKDEVDRILFGRRWPQLCSYNVISTYADRAQARGDVAQEVKFRKILVNITPDRIGPLINLASALSRAELYKEEIVVREEIDRLFVERGIRDSKNSVFLMQARALEARRNLLPKDREPRNRNY